VSVSVGIAAADMSHIPHLLHVLPSFGVGGIQVRLVALINSFGPRYRHTIVALDGTISCLERVAPGNLVEPVFFPNRAGSALRRLNAIRRKLTELQPDLLLTYNWGSIEWVLANRFFFAVSAHVHLEDGFGPDEVDGQVRRRVLVRRFALSGALKVVVPSQTLVQLALQDWRLRPDRLLHIPNGIAVDQFLSHRNVKPRFGRDRGDVVVGTIAPLRPEKNIGRLIRAVARTCNERLRLVVAGEGPERSALETEAKALLGNRALFIGSVTEPTRALQDFDIFALSSDTEQMPMTILEAMAMALPIAAVAVGDVPIMVADENRPFIVEKHDEAGLSAAIARLAEDDALRSRLGRRNACHVRAAFPFERMISSYDALLTSIVG